MVRTKEYARCHASISRRFGKAYKCESGNCSYDNPKRYEWALIKGMECSTNIEDYIQLCPSCHRKYDFTEETSKKMTLLRKGKKRQEFTGKNHFRSIPIKQYSLSGEFIREWYSVNLCANGLNIHKQGILNCLNGIMRQTKGFIFKK